MPATAEVRSTKRLSNEELVLKMLKQAGPKGCTTEQLCEISHRFSARVWDLKQKGWDIETLGRVGTDTCHFILKGTMDAPAHPDLLRAPAPAKPSNDNATGICECGHMAAWHKKGVCPCCDCKEFRPQ